MRKKLAVGISFGVAGILCAIFFGNGYFSTYGFLNEYHLRSLAESGADQGLLLWNIFWERGKMFLVLGLAAATPLKKVLPLILQCLLCFTAGIYLAACVTNMGGYGALFFSLSLLPHGLFYLAALFLMLCKRPAPIYRQKGGLIKKILFVCGILFLIFIGCALEAYVGYRIIIWLICTIYNM